MTKRQKILAIVILLIVAIVFVYYYFFAGNPDLSKIKQLVIDKSTAQKDPQTFITLINTGVNEIIENPFVMEQAKVYANETGVSIEETLVALSISDAKSKGFV